MTKDVNGAEITRTDTMVNISPKMSDRELLEAIAIKLGITITI